MLKVLNKSLVSNRKIRLFIGNLVHLLGVLQNTKCHYTIPFKRKLYVNIIKMKFNYIAKLLKTLIKIIK